MRAEVFFADEKESGIVKAGRVNIVSATGAGDAFSAACLKAFVDGLGIRETAELAMAASALALESCAAVNPLMSAELLRVRAGNLSK